MSLGGLGGCMFEIGGYLDVVEFWNVGFSGDGFWETQMSVTIFGFSGLCL